MCTSTNTTAPIEMASPEWEEEYERLGGYAGL